MAVFLYIVGSLAWLVVLPVVFMMFAQQGTDIQVILAGAFGTAGTCAYGLAAIITRLDKMVARTQPTDSANPSATEEGAWKNPYR